MSTTGYHNCGVEVEIVWFDQDLVEYQFTCSNGRFSGVAEIYLGHDDFPKMVEALKGFPSTPSDVRDLELGTFNPKHAHGGAPALLLQGSSGPRGDGGQA